MKSEVNNIFALLKLDGLVREISLGECDIFPIYSHGPEGMPAVRIIEPIPLSSPFNENPDVIGVILHHLIIALKTLIGIERGDFPTIASRKQQNVALEALRSH